MPMLSRISRIAIGLCAAIAVMLTSATSLFAADKVHLKDGTVVEGKIVREGEGFLFIEVTIGSIKSEKLITLDRINKIDRDSATNPKPTEKPAKTGDPAKPVGATVASDAAGSIARKGTATRVAILNFGAPSSWQGAIGSTVGLEISVQAFKDVIPKLEKADVDVVVIRVNSGGGLGLEVPKFLELFEKEYKSRFRTVAWIESAISAAAMSPYVIEEMYFLPEGNLGACTGWSGALNSVEGVGLEIYLSLMEEASAKGKRDPKIMRAMQIQEPLSASINPETGEVTWFQNADGDYLLNPANQIFTINASDAVKFKFARGIASTREELARAMGLQEVEWAAQDATDYIDDHMRLCDKSEKTFGNAYQKYAIAVDLARQLQDPKQRGAQIAIARRFLSEMRRLNGVNPNFALMRGIDGDWFLEQEDMLKKLAAR